MKKIRLLIIATLTLTMALAFVACNNNDENNNPYQLAAPTNVQVNGTNLTWAAVANASGYSIQINTESPINLTGSSVTVYSLSTFVTGKSYSIKVKAIGDGVDYKDSTWSSPVSYNLSNKLKVTFDSMGGSSVISEFVDKGEKIDKPDDPTKTGYTFDGWYVSDKDFTVDTRWLFAGFSVDKNTILYANWLANVYIVEYEANKPNGAIGTLSGLVIFSVHVFDESKNLNTNAYSLTGWSFDDWNTKADGSGTKYIDGQSVKNLSSNHAETITLYAQWRSGYSSGLGSQTSPFVINTAQQLKFFADKTNSGFFYQGYYFELGANINLSETEWVPIINFRGAFDGKGYAISNFQITKRGVYNTNFGFFGELNGTVKNLGLENFYINISISSTGLLAGGLAGQNYGTITNCYATGNVTATASNVSGSGNCAGGLVGINSGTIRNCYATGNITGSGYGINVGGLAGFSYNNSVENCFATGNVSAVGPDSIRAHGFSNMQYGAQYYNCYRFENQTITPANSLGGTCTLLQLDSISFYTEILKWDTKIWNFSNLNFAEQRYPTLKKY